MIINKVFIVFYHDPEIPATKVEVLKPNNLKSALILERQLNRAELNGRLTFKVQLVR